MNRWWSDVTLALCLLAPGVVACSSSDAEPARSGPVGAAEFEPVVEEILAGNTSGGTFALGHSEYVLRENGFEADWFSDHQFQWVEGFVPPMDTEVRAGRNPGEFTLCLEDECYQVVLFEDGGRRLAIDGEVVRNLMVVAPQGVDAWGWCADGIALVVATTDGVELGDLEGQIEVESTAWSSRRFRVTIDLASRAEDAADGWTIECPSP